jgi:hypothetical protein
MIRIELREEGQEHGGFGHVRAIEVHADYLSDQDGERTVLRLSVETASGMRATAVLDDAQQRAFVAAVRAERTAVRG